MRLHLGGVTSLLRERALVNTLYNYTESMFETDLAEVPPPKKTKRVLISYYPLMFPDNLFEQFG